MRSEFSAVKKSNGEIEWKIEGEYGMNTVRVSFPVYDEHWPEYMGSSD